MAKAKAKKAVKKVEKGSSKDVMKLFVSSMKSIAKDLEVAESEVSKSMFFKNDPNNISEWDIRSLGGFTALKKMHFPNLNENVVVETTSKMVASHRNKLTKQLGDHASIAQEFGRSLLEALKQTSFPVHKSMKKAAKKKVADRTIVAHLSDTHYGANIDEKEMGGLNNYTWTISARRTALFMQQVVNYKPQYRDSTDLVLCVNGDIIAGVIHDQEWFVDLLTTQFAGTLNILIQAVSYAASNFRKVRVVMTPGNHGRSMHKSSHGRGTTHKWDSYETQIFLAFKEVMKAKCANVEVEIPHTPFAIFQAQGHNFFVTHGDTVINVGNPGSAINIRGINNQINKLNASLLAKGQKFAGMLVGHVHTPTIQMTESGCMLVINGCLSGLDPYANSIGIFDSNPTQQLFEVTKKHSVGDIRLIQVAGADKDSGLDSIIKPFKAPLGE